MSDQEMYEDIESVEEIIEEETSEESVEAEEVSEAKDGVETPAAAIASVGAAGKAVKGKASVPGGEANKGDQVADKMPGTKAGMIFGLTVIFCQQQTLIVVEPQVCLLAQILSDLYRL